MSYEEEGSEFGAGVVVCLAKFSEHLQDGVFHRSVLQLIWFKNGKIKRNELNSEAEFKLSFMETYENKYWSSSDIDQAISDSMSMWMNAASDHFYDLDRDNAPECLCQLADLTLEIGHGFVRDAVYGEEEYERIRELWKESCLALDEKLGVTPDWGHW